MQAFNKLKFYNTLYFNMVLNICHPFNNLWFKNADNWVLEKVIKYSSPKEREMQNRPIHICGWVKEWCGYIWTS